MIFFKEMLVTCLLLQPFDFSRRFQCFFYPALKLLYIYKMNTVKLMLEEPESTCRITNSPRQSSPTLEHSPQIQIHIKTQASQFQVIDGEIYFQNTHSEMIQTIKINQHNRKEDPGQANLTLVQEPIITEFISQPEEDYINRQQMVPNQPNEAVNTIIFPEIQENQVEDFIENITQIQKLNPTKYKRKNNSNNSKKKMITILNQALTLREIRKLQKLIKQKEIKTNLKLNYVKDSKYGFIQYLQLLKHFFGSHYVEELFIKFSQQMLKLIDQTKKLPDSQAKDQLLSLPDYYINAFDQFLTGSVESATEIIYKKDKFKQETYMYQGIEKVMTLQNHLDALKE